MRRSRCLIAFAIFASAAPAAAQDKVDPLVLGELLFFTCRSCHVVGEVKASNGYINAGPHLNDLFGRKPGSLPGYDNYSEAMVAFGQGRVWDETTLTTFLRDPQGMVVGTKMVRAGIKNEEEIQALLAYLASFDPDGMVPK